MIQPVTPKCFEETPPRTGFLLTFNARLNCIFCRSSCYPWIHGTGLDKCALVCLSSLNPWICESLEDLPRPWIHGWCVQKGTEIFPPRNHSWMPFHCFSEPSVTPQSQCHCLESTGEASTGLKALYKREILHCCLLIFQVEKLQRLDQDYDGTPRYS